MAVTNAIKEECSASSFSSGDSTRMQCLYLVYRSNGKCTDSWCRWTNKHVAVSNVNMQSKETRIRPVNRHQLREGVSRGVHMRKIKTHKCRRGGEGKRSEDLQLEGGHDWSTPGWPTRFALTNKAKMKNPPFTALQLQIFPLLPYYSSDSLLPHLIRHRKIRAGATFVWPRGRRIKRNTN